MTQMDNDDVQVGRILSRREVLVLFGAATGTTGAGGATATAAATAAAAASSAIATAIPSFIIRPALTEGPYFVDEKLERSDIRSDPSDGSLRGGVLLDLAFAVSKISGGTCTAFEGVLVDLWHSDAAGVCSDVSDQGFTTTGKKSLRGYQTTDANGIARFTTAASRSVRRSRSPSAPHRRPARWSPCRRDPGSAVHRAAPDASRV